MLFSPSLISQRFKLQKCPKKNSSFSNGCVWSLVARTIKHNNAKQYNDIGHKATFPPSAAVQLSSVRNTWEQPALSETSQRGDTLNSCREVAKDSVTTNRGNNGGSPAFLVCLSHKSDVLCRRKGFTPPPDTTPVRFPLCERLNNV